MVSLKQRFSAPGIVVAPGIYDGLSAMLVEQSGFEAAYLSGASICYTRFGFPDIGLVSVSEVIDTLAAIRERTTIPVIVDIDTGFGNALNVQRTIRGFERAGASGVQLEDQVTPKRCGLLPQGIPVISREEQAMKIRAAVDARSSRDFLIIARTDAKSMHGLEDASARARAYIEAGADAALVMGANTPDELRYVAGIVRAPLVTVIQETPPTTELTDKLLNQVGCAFALHAGVVRYAVVKAVHDALAALHRDGNTASVRSMMASFDQYNAVLDLQKWLALEERYLGAAPRAE